MWVDSIYELDYYKGGEIPCLCQYLVYSSDLQLQGLLYNASNNNASIIFTIWSPDGLTQYEDASAYFNWYIGQYGQQKFFNAQLTEFTAAMCRYKCWIVRATVSQDGLTIFDKWTQRYCNTNCCNVASGVTFTQDNIISSGDEPAVNPDAPVSVQTNACNQQLIRLSSWFSCVDEFTGAIFTNPTSIIESSGNAEFNENYTFAINNTFRGRIVTRPRTIERDISYNCRLQKSESAKLYLFEGYEMFPAWKMTEIEGQLHSDNIYVDDFNSFRNFTWDGGTAFEKVSGARDCDEVFKLSVTLRECIIRQFFGCIQDCAEETTYYIIPASYQDGYFYGEGGELIATVYEGTSTSPAQTGLLDWFRSQDGITDVTDIDVSGLDCDMYALFSVQGTGYIPSSIFFDAPIPRNRVYSLGLTEVTDICGYAGETPCALPVIGTVVIGDVDCATPVNGTVVVGDAAIIEADVHGYGNWTDNISPHVAEVAGSQVLLSLDATNTTFIGLSGETFSFANEVFGTVDAAARPLINRVLDETNNGNIPSGMFITIGTDGSIAFSGDTTFSADNVIDLVFSNLVYDL